MLKSTNRASKQKFKNMHAPPAPDSRDVSTNTVSFGLKMIHITSHTNTAINTHTHTHTHTHNSYLLHNLQMDKVVGKMEEVELKGS